MAGGKKRNEKRNPAVSRGVRLKARAGREEGEFDQIYSVGFRKAGHVMNSCALRRWPGFIASYAMLNEGTTFRARVARGRRRLVAAPS